MGDQQKHPAANGTTDRVETPELEGQTPLPQEITGLASAGDKNLVSLFADPSAAHLADGFRGGSEDEGESDPDDDARPST
jgi:hypothetical protein